MSGVQIDVEASRSWARGWTSWSESLTADSAALSAELSGFDLDSEGPTAPGLLADAAGELMRTSLYLNLIATEAEAVQYGGGTPNFSGAAVLAYSDDGALTAADRSAFLATINAHVGASEEREQFFVDMQTMSVDELNERMLSMSPDELSVIVSSMPDGAFGNLVNLIDGQNFTSTDQDAVLLELGETLSLDAWRRFVAEIDHFDPDPSTALADSARDEPAKLDLYERLEYADFSHWTLFGTTGGVENSAPDPAHFRQGSIGDCYLISGMITLGREDAAGLGGLVTPNANGTFTVTFADGSREVVTPDLAVDPTAGAVLPNGDRRHSPIFGASEPGGVLFPSLVEKAYAQREGGYGEIVGGSSSAAIETLTGRESGWIDNDDIDIDDLADRFDSGESLGLSTIDRPDDLTNTEWKDEPDTPDTFKNSFGGTYERLHQNHAFVITDVDATAGTVSVINPWDPSRDPFELTEAELQESVNGVRTNAAP